ncbi:MAG: sigma-54-dependent Fis family transcriptional regulator [Gammaproteobacteria bacterium]|nr:sigma-54-dependent Fis family transcriptional regulator [Gammaproteobacteria bacterium]NIM73004.1 sigma-54-dependent Fis family transcriptional regulator [Gammaproteobacteria bacterium]NIN38620.1 sigma-54-dependent Fis family transcriptional regulator [Gammaproteobacteria bacterium]NIO24756.1 sigma-54-dependent Fis family transcriptional regulator [Gammaproteobacteria bacterium]NIO65359.1 sigma-54-dependent Fis family transcriptional regulator [Gammaproteobacteria bacterium]
MQLSPDDRRFFAAVAEIIFSNPFDDARAEVRALIPDAPGTGVGRKHPFAALLPPVEARLSALAADGIRVVHDVASRDRDLFSHALLFRAYQRSAEHFDRLIIEQLAAGDEPAAAPFAQALLDELSACGFARDDAGRYVALFYQIRRAYYFIADSLLGDSPAMRRLRHALWNNVFTSDVRTYVNHLWNRMEDFSTLVLGETGTGKTAAAAAIGRSGLIPYDERRGRFAASFTSTFVAANLSQYPESLIESELFGHRKGAFTGAIDNHRGLFERLSNYGALFLDEIGEVSVPIQIKLLNVLEQRRFSPVGSHEPVRFDGRVIAATNRSLSQLRESNAFRDDFLYRLCSDVIEVPPLRKRIEEHPAELEQLVSLIIARATGEASPPLTDRVVTSLEASLPDAYPWPGNVRELEQAVRRVLLNGRYDGATAGNDEDAEDALAQALREGRVTATELTSRYCRMLYAQLGSYEQVARRIDLDRRTVKKYIGRESD